MRPTSKLIAWLDQYLLELVAGFLIVFLPLYPKWPLFDILPGYIVRVRLEDFVILISLFILLVQVLRKKVKLNQNPLFYPIVIYLLIGLLSSLSAIFITKSVPLQLTHVGKLFLHWARRVEYMSLAFIYFAAITSKESLKRLLVIFSGTVLLVSLYGFGQKYLSWPVYSTMNREFAKGWRLVLTEHARVSSTFAGHYDLAAYTVVALAVLTALLVLARGKSKLIYALIFILTFATLLLTASRSSFIAYLPAISLVCLLAAKSIGRRRAVQAWIVLMLVSGIGVRSFGSVYSRFADLLMLDRVDRYVSQFTDKIKTKTTRDLELSSDLALVFTETDTPPSPVATPVGETNLPPDVYEAIPESFPEASLAAIPQSAGSGTEGKPRTYSETAYTFGLSSAIRFDVLWPKALAGFKKNPLLGSGYSTLLKDNIDQFTEAESTDNDYLRTLGETGLLGLISFYGIFILVLYKSYLALNHNLDNPTRIFLTGFIAGILGLMINALYMDIFEASKVAYTTWAFIGIASALITTTYTPKVTNKSHDKKTK